MKVLHICSDFSRQRIYDELITGLSRLGIDQHIYIPVRTEGEINRNRNKELSNVEYSYSHILKLIDRFNFFGKINKTSQDIISKIDISTFDLVHAHFLFSDGGNALKLKNKFGIPYVVAVRNTDLNFFFKYFIHLRSPGLEILSNANKIIFLSPSYRDALFKKYIPIGLKQSLLGKSFVVPNGINKYWHENVNLKISAPQENVKLLYVGDFSKNKNIQTTIKSLRLLRERFDSVEFTIVGGGGNFNNEINKLCMEDADIKIIDRTSSLDKLREVYGGADIYVMPSKYETFGLAYIEAMSQGLPVIYSLGQGIDGYFKEGTVGYGVVSGNIEDLVKKIEAIVKNYLPISHACSKQSKKFSWEVISEQYKNIYTNIKNG